MMWPALLHVVKRTSVSSSSLLPRVYFVFEGNFQVQAPGELIFGGANTWKGLFSEFYGRLD